jgi:diaminopimelate epimerase
MSGAGNLFSVIDNRNYKFSNLQGSILAKILCNINEYNEFKSEGLMFLEDKTNSFDFICKFFNPDGSTGMMCGNGGRVITRFADMNGIIKDKSNINFFMSGNQYKAKFDGNDILLFMPPPEILPKKMAIIFDLKKYEGYYSNTGTHHFVVNTMDNDIDFNNFDILNIGSEIRYSNNFKPNGTNVNFINISESIIHLRTYEKGVELETGACGTGAVATALTANQFYNLDFPISIIPTSGERLLIDCIKNNDEIINMILQGPAKLLYNIQISLPDNIFT